MIYTEIRLLKYWLKIDEIDKVKNQLSELEGLGDAHMLAKTLIELQKSLIHCLLEEELTTEQYSQTNELLLLIVSLMSKILNIKQSFDYDSIVKKFDNIMSELTKMNCQPYYIDLTRNVMSMGYIILRNLKVKNTNK
jgi:hypothetical protein